MTMGPLEPGPIRGIRVVSVVVDCTAGEFEAMPAFWSHAPGYAPREEGWAVLHDPEGRGVNVSLQVVPEPRAGKNRPHLDLYTSDHGAEVDRLIGTGAESYHRTSGPDEDFVTLVDPGGNLFDAIQKDT